MNSDGNTPSEKLKLSENSDPLLMLLKKSMEQVTRPQRLCMVQLERPLQEIAKIKSTKDLVDGIPATIYGASKDGEDIKLRIAPDGKDPSKILLREVEGALWGEPIALHFTGPKLETCTVDFKTAGPEVKNRAPVLLSPTGDRKSEDHERVLIRSAIIKDGDCTWRVYANDPSTLHIVVEDGLLGGDIVIVNYLGACFAVQLERASDGLLYADVNLPSPVNEHTADLHVSPFGLEDSNYLSSSRVCELLSEEDNVAAPIDIREDLSDPIVARLPRNTEILESRVCFLRMCEGGLLE